MLTKIKKTAQGIWSWVTQLSLIGKAILAAVLIVVIGGGFLALAGGGSNGPDTVKITRGTAAKTVTATGKAEPGKEFDLGFEVSGKVSYVGVEIGNKVGRGQLIARLSAGSLGGSLQEAVAAVAVARARLSQAKEGNRVEDVAVSDTEIERQKDLLNNAYRSAAVTLSEAYTSAFSGINSQLGNMFTDTETESPELTFRTSNFQAETDVENGRAQARYILEAWQQRLDALNDGSLTQDEIITEMSRSQGDIRTMISFLDRIGAALDYASISLSDSEISSYKGQVASARASLSAANTSITRESNSIVAAQASVRQAESQRDLKAAPAREVNVAIEEAAVNQALARVSSIRSDIGRRAIYAPTSGTVSKVEIEVGEIAGPSTPAVSMISAGALEVEVTVPEINIGAIEVGNETSAVFDAFGDEEFTGKVVSIEPAETLVDGVSNYIVRVSVDPEESKKLKSGMTATVTIQTEASENALVVPQFALLETEGGTFVRKIETKNRIVEVAVTVGIRGKNGMVEISGNIEEGDEVEVILEQEEVE